MRKALLTPQEAASILGVAVQTLAVWRTSKRYDLSYVKVGRLVRYQEDDIKEYLSRNTRK